MTYKQLQKHWTKRAKRIIALYDSGKTFAEIGVLLKPDDRKEPYSRQLICRTYHKYLPKGVDK
jgi:hypothetical protein